MFKDNSHVLSRVDANLVEKALKALSLRRDVKYVKFLGALCSYKNSSLHTNQKLICEKLLKFEGTLAVKLVRIETDRDEFKICDLTPFG